ncbi:erythromycin esterase family protein [Chitinophaga sp. G-6-1-13]|uniref:Erythromycin esterase family protein n=1 Tax=Chitinophaga fulva TaxID=2728842 RepID=A0A848GMR5_9BACT|nr:erythromycin esterase family protein [Chitinophaga fulva]NML37248.1 erythromycin esterase family protein [Chitinophaga fulva]
MKQLFYLCCMLLLPVMLSAQGDLSVITTNNPDSVNFSDLSFLKHVLKDVQVVSLGEQSHGDGATFDAKVRLIKYLHEELGYNVIAFESGLYDCTKANELIQAGGSAEEYLFKAIFGIWDCKEVGKLATYINETKKSSSPLLLSGFDCQVGGRIAKKDFIADVNQFVKELERKTGKQLFTDTVSVNEALRKAVKFSNFFTKLSSADTAILSATFAHIFEAADNAGLSDATTQYWTRVLNSLMVDYRRKFEKNSIRDITMSENVLWLLKEKYKGQKIILWAASAHLAYNVSLVDDKYLSNHTTMGDKLKHKLGNEYYSMLFTSYHGKSKAGIINLKVDRPAVNGIEQFFYAARKPFLFGDLREKSAGGLCDHDGNTKVFGHKPLKMKLCEMADGIFYIENMYPATY